jgi:hypothetical protein
MKTITRLLLIVCIALPFAACKKPEAAVPVKAAELTAPASSDDVAWKMYLQDVTGHNMGNIINTPYLYYLTSQSDPNFEAKYKAQLDQVQLALARGVVGGNMIAFGSPESEKMADIVVTSFKGVPADKLKGVRVLFIGQVAEKDRVGAVVAPTGADFVFIEAR